jgi:nucleoside-diphosphate-sugar epimerase
LISYKTEAGGGTTDYAVEVYYSAVKNGSYDCYLDRDTALPLLFMPDAIKATIDLMEADPGNLSVHSAYNLGGMSITPGEIHAEIIKQIPDFKITYSPDFRQAIAETWPQSIDDSISARDWGCSYRFDLESMTEIMIEEISKKLNLSTLR